MTSNQRHAKTDTGPTSPVSVGDRIRIAPGLTALTTPVWAVVDFTSWVLAEEILRGNATALPWKIGYRIPRAPGDGRVADQLGVIFLDEHGHDADGFVLDVERSPRSEL